MVTMVILVTVLIVLLTRIYFILPKHTKNIKKQKRTKPCKTCIFLGSGGHTAEMLQLIKSLNPERYTPRSYITATTDILSKEKAILYEESLNKGMFEVYKIARGREVGQSLYSVPFTMTLALLASSKVLIKAWPDLIICNGPGSCIPICMLAYIPRIFGIKKIEMIYIESFARVDSLSLTGKLLYPFMDRFLVQWPELTNLFNKAEYFGILV